MSLDADAIVDRRRMRRKLTFWRVSALVIALLAVIGTAFVLVPGSRLMPQGAYIARIQVQGLIRGNQGRVEALARLGKSRARAVIVHIDSPGGTTAGSEQLYNALRELQSKKPMVVVVDGLAASGAYIAALSAEHIVAQETSFAWFKGLVKDRRKMDDPLLAQVSDGRVFTGRQAVGLKLVDGLGNEKAALDWLEKEKKVPASTPVRDYSLQPRFSELSFLHVAAWTFEAVGLNVIAHRIEEWGAVQAVERLNLDGLLALWHPPSSN
jgi:protease-4